MNNSDFEKYNQKRQDVIKKYKKKKLKEVLLILAVGLASVIVIACLNGVVFNIAVTLVLSAMVIMFTVIFARIRAVTVNHILQTRLQFLEQDEPAFHVEFKK